eukprot:11736695-Alexandrium_andersonii.AAC.1
MTSHSLQHRTKAGEARQAPLSMHLAAHVGQFLWGLLAGVGRAPQLSATAWLRTCGQRSC